MPVALILCRLKDDHSTTAMLGQSALLHFSDWEPVPDETSKPVTQTKTVTQPKTGKAAQSAASKE